MAFLAKDGFKTSGNLNYHAGFKPTATDIGIASTAQAVAGADNTTIMTPLRVKEYVSNLGYASTVHNHDASYLSLMGGSLTGDLLIQKVLPLLTLKNTSGTDVEIILDRSNNANWKMVNSSGILKFQSDYTSGKGTYYDALKLDYNTGNLWVKGVITEGGTLLSTKYAPKTHTHTSAQVTGLATVATSGSYNDLLNLPTLINDTATVTTQTWSSSQIKSVIDTRFTDLIGTAPGALDTLKELADALGNDPSFATTITTELGLKATTTYVNTELAKKASTAVATQAINGLMSSTDKTKLDGITAGAAPNQNTFSYFKVGTTTVAADNATDTVELIAGTGITLTANATTDQITISGVNQYTHPTGDGNSHIPANGTGNSGKYLQATGVAGSYQWVNLPTASTSLAGIVQLGTGATNAATGNHAHTMTMWTVNKTITVAGDANTYYPVVIDVPLAPTTIEIYRGYSDAAPNTWNTATHRGSLQLRWTTCDGQWGGTKTHRTEFFSQNYSKQVANVETVAHGYKTTIWLRGGGAQYVYRCTENVQPVIYYERSLIFDSTTDTYDVYVEPTTTISEPYNTYWTGATDHNYPILDNTQRVYSPLNKPSLADLGAAAATHTHDYAASTHSHSYLPLSGGTMSDNATPITLVRSSSPNLNICFQNTTTGSVGTKYLGTYQGTSLRFGNSADLSSGYEIYHAGNKPSAADIGAAASSHTHSYLPLSGGTLTGKLTFNANQYFTSSSPAINLNNSDIIGTNCIVFADESDSTEGIFFPKAGKTGASIAVADYDVIKSYQSYLYYNTNKVYHEGYKPSAADIGAAAASHTHTGYATSSHTHSDYAKVNHTHSDYATSNITPITASQIGSYEGMTFCDTNEVYDSGLDTGYGQVITLKGGSGTTQIINETEYEEPTLKVRQKYLNYEWGPFYSIYHEGYKPSAAAIGAAAASHTHSYLPLSGGTLAGELGLTNAYPCITMNQNGSKARLITDREYFWVEGTTSGASTPTSRLSFSLLDGEMYIGNANSRVYHQNFKPTAADVGALSISGGDCSGSIGANYNGKRMVMGTGATDTYLWNSVSDKYLQMKDDGTLSYSNNVIYHAGNKPSTSDIGAAKALTTANGYQGFTLNDGATSNWIRTTINGIIPYQSGGASSLGTSGWPFSNIFSNAYYLRGSNIEDLMPLQIGDAGIIKNRLPKSGFYEKSVATTTDGYPITPSNGWMHIINCQHSNGANNYALQIAAPFHEQRFFARSTNGNGSTGWSEFYHTGFNREMVSQYKLTAHCGLVGSDFAQVNIELRETNQVGIAQSVHTYAPSMGFHWANRCAASIAMHSDGNFYFRAQGFTGTEYRSIYCNELRAVRAYNAVWNDYAEYFEKEDTEDQSFEPGDVIASINDKYVKSTCAYQETLVGVYSDSFGHIVGGTGEQEKDDKECIPVGLAGRVYVKVTGKVKNGQLLTSSDIPGVAMYAETYKPGTIIGKAVEDKDTEEIGKVKMFIMNS